jgi:cobalt-zinc-cadmium resistance protein CzcA
VGSETQRPFALVIVGGMVTTLVTALFVLPAVYARLARPSNAPPGDADVRDAAEGRS